AASPRGLARLAFGVPLEGVLGNRLPLARVVHERVPLRPDPVTRIEEPEPDASDLSRVGVLAPERAAALRAEALCPAVARRILVDQLLAGEQPERIRREPRLCRSCGARAPLAARAVAVAGAQRFLRHLEADAAAQAVTRVQGLAHCSSGDGGI